MINYEKSLMIDINYGSIKYLNNNFSINLESYF